jgi:hypothetical protein
VEGNNSDLISENTLAFGLKDWEKPQKSIMITGL